MEKPIKKKSAEKSMELAKTVRQVVKGLNEKAHQAHANGEPIAYLFIASAYDEILRTMDITSVGTENFAGLCAVKNEAGRFLKKAESEGYARHLCTYATVGLGFDAMRCEMGCMPPDSPDGGLVEPTVMLGTGMMICDPRYKWYQAATRYNKAPAHVQGQLVPALHYTHVEHKELKEYYVKYIVEELKELIEFLQRETGKKMHYDRLSESVALSEKTIQKWWDAYQLRTATPAPMSTEDAVTIMVPGNFMLGTQMAYDFYCKLYDDLKHRVDNKIGVIKDEKYRLLWALSLPPWYGLSMFNYFGSQGAVFPIEAVYHSPEPQEFPEGMNDPLERIAWRSYGQITQWQDKARLNSGDYNVEWFLDLIERYQLDGVVFHQANTCRTIHTGQLNQIQVLKKHTDKPVLLLEGDIVDIRNYDKKGTENKIDAFIEVVDAYKKRKEG